MPVTNENIASEVAIRSAIFGMHLARRATGSRTLSDSMSARLGKVTTRRGVAHIQVPHYWAVFKHDGTGVFAGKGPIVPRKSTGLLAWFKNPEMDPRFSVYPPVRLRHYRPPLKLKGEEFRRLVRQGELRLAKSSPGVPPTRFFENDGPMRPVKRETGKIAKELTSELVISELRKIRAYRVKGSASATV